jgi:phosphate transport system substrate-binding protein
LRLNRIIPSFGIAVAISAGVAILTTNSPAAPMAHESASLNGAGSSLVAPMVEKVFAPEFQKSSGVSVNYSAVGSGAGIEDISKGTVDFGASDAPLDEAQVSGCGGCLEIPWALASTGFSINLGGIKEVKLSGPVIAEIYLGKITNWDDSKIKAMNKGVALPNETITPVYRSDGSGDTYVFTRYLSEISSEWKSKVGYGTSVSFPTGKGGKGNSGVAAIVASTPGAIGNNSSFYIRETQLGEVSVQNNAGYFVHPYIGNVTSAAKAMLKKVPSLTKLTSSSAAAIATDLNLTDVPFSRPKKGKKLSTLQHEEANSYPLSTFTYILVRPGSSSAATVGKLVEFAVKPSIESKGSSLAFSVLPKSVESADIAAAKTL